MLTDQQWRDLERYFREGANWVEKRNLAAASHCADLVRSKANEMEQEQIEVCKAKKEDCINEHINLFSKLNNS